MTKRNYSENRQIFSYDFKASELQYVVADKRKNTIFCSSKKSLKKLKKNLKNIEKMLDLIKRLWYYMQAVAKKDSKRQPKLT